MSDFKGVEEALVSLWAADADVETARQALHEASAERARRRAAFVKARDDLFEALPEMLPDPSPEAVPDDA